MAIRFIRNWHTIIINVERANKKIEGGLIALLSDYYPPKEKTMLEKIKSIFSSAKPLTLSDFDNMHFSSGTRVFAENGCDGNLYFLSFSDRKKADGVIMDLEQTGLVSSKKSSDCDFYIYDDTVEVAHPCKWLSLLMKEEPFSPESILASYAYLSIHPFRLPFSLQKDCQGNISYNSQYCWEVYQQYVKGGNAQGMHDVSNIQIRHLNATLWDKEVPSLDVFVRAYVEKGIKNIAPKYRFILDGSKDTNDIKQEIITFNTPVKKCQNKETTTLESSDNSNEQCKSPELHCSKDASQQCKVNILGKYFRLEQIVSMAIGKEVLLKPVDAGILVNEYNELDTIPIIAKEDSDLRKYLPGMDLSTKESTQSFFFKLVQLSEWGQQFGYTIRLGSIVVGLVFINTPDYNKNSIGFDGWTIDFATFPMFQRKHMMSGVLPHILAFLKNTLNVDTLYAVVNQENYKCINLLTKACFDDTGETLRNPADKSTAKLLKCPLSLINFKRR